MKPSDMGQGLKKGNDRGHKHFCNSTGKMTDNDICHVDLFLKSTSANGPPPILDPHPRQSPIYFTTMFNLSILRRKTKSPPPPPSPPPPCLPPPTPHTPCLHNTEDEAMFHHHVGGHVGGHMGGGVVVVYSLLDPRPPHYTRSWVRISALKNTK